ncbi:MAG: hypothetical protein IJ475_03810 [Bacilli bacterium]|nr:hypothetical protein [Bacilli bacterium]
MNKIVAKFTEFLNKSVDGIELSIVVNARLHNSKDIMPEDEEKLLDIANRKRIARIISIPESEWQLHAEVFNEFGLFSRYLIESPLTDNERAELSFYFIRKNIGCGILEADASGFDAPKIKDYKFKYITPEEFEELIRKDAYRKLQFKDKSELTEKERLQLEDITNFVKDNPLDLSDIINRHKVIKDLYFDKKPNLSKGDLLDVVKTLYAFGFDKQVIKVIKTYLYRTCNIVVNNVDTTSVSVRKVEIRKQEDVISVKEYNKLEQELKKYFNLSNMEVVRELSADEEIYCLYLMKKMKLSTDTIDKVLRKIKRVRLNRKQNPVEQYLYMFNKIKYYSNISEVSDKLKELEHCFSNLFIADDDSYLIFKEYIRLLLDELHDYIPNTYDYEHQAAEDYEMKLTR